MPFKDPQALREYQRGYVAKRRAAFFEGKACIDCGSVEKLQIDHLDPADKLDHRVWSWAQARRVAELAKCVVRCQRCHMARHYAERRQEHGLGAYKRGCRCGLCRAAKAESQLRYRQSLQERQAA